jgi:hypothetical protein
VPPGGHSQTLGVLYGQWRVAAIDGTTFDVPET